MTFRGQHVVRCPACRLEARLCMCANIPCLPTRTRVVIVMHYQEIVRPTNTGRLVERALPNAEIVLRGHPDRRPAVIDVPEGRPTFVLHPDAQRVLVPSDAEPAPVLLVPDGTWSQSRRLLKREPSLRDATRVTLPPGPPSIYCLRQDPRPSHLATVEAVARALGILEGPEVERALLELLRDMVRRTLVTRGRLHESALVPPRAPID